MTFNHDGEMVEMYSEAEFSPCEKYRYTLKRIWNEDLSPLLFFGLNPSSADHAQNDPTISRIINFAMDWGAGGLYMGNIFAFRATLPARMKVEFDPIGPDNDKHLIKMAKQCPVIVAGWGADGGHMGRDKEIVRLFPLLHCLHVTKEGYPGHPLYLPKNLAPYLYTVPGWNNDMNRKQDRKNDVY
jgi:hypothetical protein